MSHGKDEETPPAPDSNSGQPKPPAIHPSFIQVAKPYVFEQTIHGSIHAMGVNPMREETILLQGVLWIDNVRKALNLYVQLEATNCEKRRGADRSSPVRTYDTAVMYYHRFRLVHPDNEYNYMVLLSRLSREHCLTFSRTQQQQLFSQLARPRTR